MDRSYGIQKLMLNPNTHFLKKKELKKTPSFIMSLQIVAMTVNIVGLSLIIMLQDFSVNKDEKKMLHIFVVFFEFVRYMWTSRPSSICNTGSGSTP